jgi:DNA-binding NarL/FixJ family response regulator
MSCILLADDQKSVRSALRLLLEQEHDIEVIGEARNAGILLTKVASNCPDLLLLDWGLPGMSPQQLIPTINRLCPQTSVIVLSGRPGVEEGALSSGAEAFVSKSAPPEQLLETVQALLSRMN